MSDATTEPPCGPEVWTGADLAGARDWWTSLGAAQVEELRSATDASADAQIDDTPFAITRERFPLRTAAHPLAAAQAALRRGRGLHLVRGLPVAGIDQASAARMLWGIGTHVGAAEPQDAAGSLLHEVRDTGRDLGDGNVRYYQTSRAIGFHNDGADGFMLLCVNPAMQGGESRVVSVTAVFNELVRRAPKAAALLQQPFHFDLRGQHPDDATPYQVVPIFIRHAGQIHALYKRGYIESGQRLPGVPELTDAQVAALDLLDELCDELAFDFTLARGDLLVGNNYLVLHDRRAFVDGAPPRLILRLWLSIPGGSGVPPQLADTREFRHSHARHLQWGVKGNAIS